MNVSILLNALFSLCTVGALISCVSVLSKYSFLADLITNFRIQYFVAAVVCLLLALLFKRKKLAILFTLVGGLHLAQIVSSLVPLNNVNVEHENEVQLNLVTSNLLVSNDSYQQYFDDLAAESADIIVFQEYTYPWHHFLSLRLDEYPYRITLERGHAFGIALYSRHPFVSEEILYFSTDNKPSVQADVLVEGRTIRVIGTHAPAPVSRGLYNLRNQHLANLASHVANAQLPLIVTGDFNVTTWSYWFQNLVSVSGLVDARRGHGVHATWPVSFAPALIPIDHVLTSGDLAVTSLKTGANLGSDHRSVVATLALPSTH